MLSPRTTPAASHVAAAGLLLAAVAISGSGSRPAPDPSHSWLTRAQQSVAAREYRASPSPRGLQAPNRAHGLRTYFDEVGIRVHERLAPERGKLLTLSLLGVGRGEALQPVGPGQVTSRLTRVEIRRPSLVEWYENSPAGIEQGFTLEHRPEGAGALVIELAFGGASARLCEARIVFDPRTGRQLGYGALAAFDARGRRLESHFELRGDGRLRLVVRDTDAAYPVVVDPLLVSAEALIVSDQTDSKLGFSVASAGDVDGNGGDDVILGAYLYDGGESNEGAAFVFLGSATGISGEDPGDAAAELQSNQIGAEFGISVAGAGDVDGDDYDDVIVGARGYDAGEADEGAAFVFLGGPARISDGNPSTADARLEGNQDSALFGASVAGAGDVNRDGYDDVIVGAYLYESDPNSETDEGAAFVFLGGPSGVADGNPTTASARLESNQDFSLFGLSVAGAGDTNGDDYDDVIVGAPAFDAGDDNEGTAYVFPGGAGGVTDGHPGTAATRLQGNQQDANFGFSVAGAGDVNRDGFGDVIVGADEYSEGQIGEGAAFVFMGGAMGIDHGDPDTADARLESNQPGADFGISVAGAGDVDGDSYDDLIVGAHLFDFDPGSDEGAAFVFVGGPSGVTSESPAATLASPQPDSEMGRSVAGADVDGDGRAELLVGAPGYDGALGTGAAFVFSVIGATSVPALSPLPRALLAALLVGAAAGCLSGRRDGSRARR